MKRHPARKCPRFFPRQVFRRLYGRALASMTPRELDVVQFFARRNRRHGLSFVVLEGVLQEGPAWSHSCKNFANAVLANADLRVVMRTRPQGA